MNRRLAAAVCATLLTTLIGCAAPPKTREVLIRLAEPVGVQTADHNGLRYLVEIRGAYADIPEAAPVPAPGRLWVAWMDPKTKERGFAPLEEVNNIVTGSDKTTRIALKDGGVKYSVSRGFVICDVGHTPSGRDHGCNRTWDFEAKAADIRAYSSIGNAREHRRSMDRVLAYLTQIVATYSPSGIKEAVAMHDRSYQHQERQKVATQQANIERARDAERQRVEFIKKAPKGTVVNCTSNFLLDRGQPVGANVSFKCSEIGSVQLGELRNAGWRTRVTARIPTEAMIGVGDSIEMEAEKIR